MATLPYIIIHISSKDVADGRKERATANSCVPCKLAIIKDVTAEIDERHEVGIAIVHGKPFEGGIARLVADSTRLRMAHSEMHHMIGRLANLWRGWWSIGLGL